MKRTMILVLAAFALSLPAASAQGRIVSARDSACRGLPGALFALCRVYCDALHCADRSERRVCEPLRRLYERVSRGSTLPCEVEPPVCGDGEVNQAGEECDDGNNADCDGCSFDCRGEFCGDGTVCAPEECEPGDACDGDQSCSEDCTCPPPPPPSLPCGEASVPECGGDCPSGSVCRNAGDACQCFSQGE